MALWEAINEARAHFIQAMDDDFNSAEALPAVFKLVKEVNTLIEGALELPVGEALHKAKETILELTSAVGLDLKPEGDWLTIEAPLRELARSTIGMVPGDVSREAILNALLDRRESARRKREWDVADAIRDQLQEIGVEVEDTATGPRWKLIIH